MKKSVVYIRILFVMIGYALLYAFYNIVINLLHSSFSIVSVPTILAPYILLVLVTFNGWTGMEQCKQQRAKKFLIVLVISATIPVIYLGIQLGINESNSRFTQEKWQEQLHGRVYMVDHMLNKL